MPPNIKVCVNGFVLSTLLFDCANNSGDQEGFLYGSVTRNLRREISDQSLINTQEDILISVCSSVPCGSFLSFYNNIGHVSNEELECNLGERRKSIIGWYRYRRYSAMYPSAREVSVHKSLRNAIPADLDTVNSYFVYAILSSSNLPNFATHSYDYAFFTQRRDDSFRPLSTTILNLGDTRNSYRAGSMALPFMNSTSFNSVLNSSWNFQSFFEIEDQIQQFHQSLRSKLESLQEELAASDAVNATLEDDIRRLSNEMQSLLACQDALPPYSSHTATDVGTAASETSSTDSDGNGETEGDALSLKRSADDPLEFETSAKRACRDKYFEIEEPEDEDNTDEGVAEPMDTTSEITPKSGESAAFTSSQLFTVDPDNGETSQSNSDKAGVTPVVAADIKDMNLIPSPSSTVEVVISDTGVQSYYLETEEIRSSSPDVSEMKESISEPPSSPKEVDSSNPASAADVTTDADLQSEGVDTVLQDAGENSAEQSISTLVKGPSSSEESPRKMLPPFIIYASKESGGQLKDLAACGIHEETDQCVQFEPAEINQEKPVLPSGNSNSQTGDASSPVTSGYLKKEEKDKSNVEKQGD